jgi:hypothetical protein
MLYSSKESVKNDCLSQVRGESSDRLEAEKRGTAKGNIKKAGGSAAAPAFMCMR